MYGLTSGSVLKVGLLCFVDSCSSPFIIIRILSLVLGAVFEFQVFVVCVMGVVSSSVTTASKQVDTS